MKRWTKKETEFLEAHYGKILCAEIARRMKRSWRSVEWKARHLKLKTMMRRQPKLTKKRLCKLNVKLVGEYTISNIATEFLCPFCGKIFLAKPKFVAVQDVKSCGCVAIGKRKGTSIISATYFGRARSGAILRNLEFDITIEYIHDLLISQKFRCALSGIPIRFVYDSRDTINNTASLDRIDSDYGYIKGNLQWIHKDLQKVKNTLSNNEMIDWCNTIYKYNTTQNYILNDYAI